MIATLVFIVQCLLGLIIGAVVFYNLKPSLPEWGRAAIAGIVVIVFILGTVYFIGSHSLIPGYRHFLAREDY